MFVKEKKERKKERTFFSMPRQFCYYDGGNEDASEAIAALTLVYFCIVVSFMLRDSVL